MKVVLMSLALLIGSAGSLRAQEVQNQEVEANSVSESTEANLQLNSENEGSSILDFSTSVFDRSGGRHGGGRHGGGGIGGGRHGGGGIGSGRHGGGGIGGGRHRGGIGSGRHRGGIGSGRHGGGIGSGRHGGGGNWHDREARYRRGGNGGGRYGGYRPYPGWNNNWRWNRGTLPPNWSRGIYFPPYRRNYNIPSNYFQCTAFDQYQNAYTAGGINVNQAAYNALYSCGGQSYEYAGCYIPQGYCQRY